LLTALLHPYDEAKLKRALLSRLFGFDLARLLALEQSAEGLSHYIQQFDDIREMWLNQGFLVAWQRCLNQFGIWQQLVATQSKDNERAVVNLRHLTDLLSQHSEHVQGMQNLYHWYLKQLNSPSDREWELEHKLSSEAGVQLMTIHQSRVWNLKSSFCLEQIKQHQTQKRGFKFLNHRNPAARNRANTNTTCGGDCG
jgi:exodeoxyribonuclease V beta subunit